MTMIHTGLLTLSMELLDLLILNGHGPLLAAFREHPTYKLVLTGHSLGAGVVTLLSVEIRAVRAMKTIRAIRVLPIVIVLTQY